MYLPSNWRPALGAGLMVLLLVGLGIAKFSGITSDQRQEIELEAGLEQLYWVERGYHAEHGRFFDPTAPGLGLEWEWMGAFEWDARIRADTFWIAVRADLNGDGQVGMWVIDERTPVVYRLAPD